MYHTRDICCSPQRARCLQVSLDNTQVTSSITSARCTNLTQIFVRSTLHHTWTDQVQLIQTRSS